MGCAFDHGQLPGDAAPPDVPMNTDRDFDGVLDAVDNCPTQPNTDQRDHDNDAHGDICDRCPHLASAEDPDGDGDGVGDACDPRPDTAGDSRMFWEPFDNASAIATWSNMGTGGNWSVANGTLNQTLVGVDTILNQPGTLQRPYVATQFTVSALGPNAWIGFRTGANGFTQYYACLMSFGPKVLATSYSGTQNENQSVNWAGSFATGASVQLVQNHAAANNCAASQSTLNINATTSVTGSRAGTFQFYTRDAAASFDYVFVVEIGP
jgi:hypothetical protein